MSQPTQLAKEARSMLAKALEALQSSPEVPDSLLEMAEPIAKTMGMLHRIEKSQGRDLDGVQVALDNVRGTLDKLQAASADHPSADDAMEHVAASLSKLFALAKAEKAGARGNAQPAAAAAPGAASAQAAQAAAVARGPIGQAADRLAADRARAEHEPPTQPSGQSPGQAVPAGQVAKPSTTQPSTTQPSTTRPSTTSPQPEFTPRGTVRMEKPNEMERLKQGQAGQPVGQTLPVQERPVWPDAPPAGQPQAAGASADAGPHREPQAGARPAGRVVEVELGAHSSSNFYKGLSGNDVIDHGGIFVQTYTLPKLGETVSLRIHLPGDLEFLASGVVQWTRETRAGDSEPGFGARFTQISDEGRQLVYRYARNREPIFYDDL